MNPLSDYEVGLLTIFLHYRGDADMHARIFDKYGQVDPSAHRATPNRGLGLYFCRLAVEAHGGRIFLDDAGPVSFVFELPGKR